MHEQITRLESCRAGWHGARPRGPCTSSTGSAILRRRKPCRGLAERRLRPGASGGCGVLSRTRRALPVVHEAVAGRRSATRASDPLLGQESAEITGQGCGYLLDLRARQPCRGRRVAALGPRSTSLPMDSRSNRCPPARMVVPGNPRRFRSLAQCQPSFAVPAPGSGSLLSPDPAEGPVLESPSLPVPVVFPGRRPNLAWTLSGRRVRRGDLDQIFADRISLVSSATGRLPARATASSATAITVKAPMAGRRYSASPPDWPRNRSSCRSPRRRPAGR